MPIPTHWTPPVGAKFKLKVYEDYGKIRHFPGMEGYGFHAWSWLVCHAPPHDGVVSAKLCAETAHSDDVAFCDVALNIPVEWIDPPLGWQPIYPIYVEESREKALEVASWVRTRGGIRVQFTTELTTNVSVRYSPGDAPLDNEVHWKFDKNGEVVTDPDRIEVLYAEMHDLGTSGSPGPDWKNGDMEAFKIAVADFAKVRKKAIASAKKAGHKVQYEDMDGAKRAFYYTYEKILV